MRSKTKRAMVAAAAAGAMVVPLTVVAHAAVVQPATARTGSLVQVGPIADHGYPTWYRDSNGVRLEGCWSTGDPLCAPLADEMPNPNAPASYPDNFPGEHFYQLASAQVVAGVAGTVFVGMDLEGAWAAEEVIPGDQIVFGRIRIRADAADGTYRVTHPYGMDEFVATGGEGINMTEDIGITPGAFGAALQSRVGPFLTWDTFGTTGPDAPPEGYVGNPGIDHRVKGSPYDTNFVRVERKAADGSWLQVGYTDLFSVQGRLARNDGVDVQQATYRIEGDTTVVEVFASSEAGEAIRMIAPDLGYKGITLEEDEYTVRTSETSSHQAGRYYGRFAVKPGVPVTGGDDATEIVIQNASDIPVASKTVKLSDVVTVNKAAYDGSSLTIEASSSDPAAALSVVGYGDLVGGVATFGDVDAPPHVITVTSSEGGTTTVPLGTSGPFTQPDPPVAVVTVNPTRPIVNQPLTLDASGSLDATSFEWTTLSAPASSGVPYDLGTAATATFTPARAGLYEFSVVAVGDTGRSPAQLVSVQVLGATATVTARPGAAQTVRRGTLVTLDGSMSVGAHTYKWEQVPNVAGQTIPADHVVTLSDPTSAKPTFTFPLMALPAAPGPNSSYLAVPATPLRFRLTVTGVDGTTTSIAETVVRPQLETLTVVEARYRTRGEWRVEGTSDILAGQRVAIVLHSRLNAAGSPTLASARGVVIGYAEVDALGTWSYVGPGPNPQTSTPVGTTVTVVSSQGDQAVGSITVTS